MKKQGEIYKVMRYEQVKILFLVVRGWRLLNQNVSETEYVVILTCAQ